METELTRAPSLADDPSLARDPAQRRSRARRPSEAPMVDITPAEQSSSEAQPAPRPRYLMLPAIAPERRQRIIELHHRAAAVISRAMREYLREGDYLRFDGLSFLSYREVSAAAEKTSVGAAFNVEKRNVPGVLIANVALTTYLARAVFASGKKALDEVNPIPLSRLEKALAAKAIGALIDHLGAFYSDAGVGNLRCDNIGELGESPVRLDPDESLMVIRLRLGTGELAPRLTIAAGVALLAAFPVVNESTPLRLEPPSRTRSAEVPITASIVLGSWKISFAELMELRLGDELVLPDGEDAWLMSGGLRLQRLRLSFAHNRLQASPR